MKIIRRFGWDEWRGTLDGRPALYIKHLFCVFGYHVDLHKIAAADDPECFHTHPANAVRIILWGGYVEEMRDGTLKDWEPGRVGIVTPDYCHRIHTLPLEVYSLSLWLRGRRQRDVELHGAGWQQQKQTHNAANTRIIK